MSLSIFGLWLPANAAPPSQIQYSTPTPGTDGRIVYIAQEGDTCIRISLVHSITLETFRQLNAKLDENCTIIPGQEYIIGIASPTEIAATAGPSPTPPPPTASPTPFSGSTDICVLLFDDQNGDALRQETEPAIAGGAVSVTELNGEYSSSMETTINPDPEAYQGVCFSDVPEGSYNVTVGIPDNYNATMRLDYSLDVKAGDIAYVDFGAQTQIGIQPTPEGPEGPTETSLALGIVGAAILLGGIGLGIYAWRAGKPESKLSGGNILRKK
jgi:hypothetical protein